MSVDEFEDSKALALDLKLSFPLAADIGGGVAKAYGAFDAGNEIAWPAVFLVSSGQVAARWLTQDYSERPATTEILKEARLLFPAGAQDAGATP